MSKAHSYLFSVISKTDSAGRSRASNRVIHVYPSEIRYFGADILRAPPDAIGDSSGAELRPELWGLFFGLEAGNGVRRVDPTSNISGTAISQEHLTPPLH